MAWQQTTNLSAKRYTCGYCNHVVSSAVGYHYAASSGHREFIHICPDCSNPTYFGETRVPGVAPGNNVKHLPANVHALYNEARQCASVAAYTSSILACRKLLMNIAVNHGAKEGLSFVAYVEHLSGAGFVPPNGKGWVDYIRKKGNEATHEIALMTEDDSTRLLAFAEMLLKFVYEFPAAIPAP